MNLVHRVSAAEEWSLPGTLPEVFKSGDYKYQILEDGTVSIFQYTGKATKVKFPSTLAGRKVTRISRVSYDSVFEYNHAIKVTSVVIPEGVTVIDGSFNWCINLKSVTLPDSLLIIYSVAFGGCKSLIEIKLPKKLEFISGEAFGSCQGLKEISIPDSVVEMDGTFFGSCTSLKKIKLSKNASIVSLGAMESIASITIPEGVVEASFYKCTRLEKINLPSTLKKLEIHKNDSLESCNIPEGVEVIDLVDCRRLIKVNIPDSTTEVSLRGCTKIKSIKLPTKLKYIKDKAFYGCKSL